MILMSGDVHMHPGPHVNNNNMSESATVQGSDDTLDYECLRSKGMNFVHLNVRSLLPKLDELRMLAADTKIAVIGITETWLDASVTDSEVEMPGYLIVRRDRNRNGGGVCMYIRSDIAFNPRGDISDNLEIVWTELFIPKTKPILHITSVDRCQVNRILMTAAEKTPNVHIHFDHKLQCCDLDEGKANFITSTGDKVECRADLIVGCDGAHSQLRCQIMKKIPMNFRQEYLPHQYMELRMTPKTKKFDINGSNYLHVWPRTKFMLLSMPDFEEQCYVSILTMPEDMFKGITKAKQLTDFFRKHFPDFLEFIGVEEKDLVDTFFSWGPVPLISVKCEPYHYQDKAVFMGDAAHAMYPFYGQGMNCGFEDCQRFNELLDKHHDDLSKVLEEFSATRKPDVDAMIDLSERQYNLLMDTVTSKRFTMRKYIDNILHWVMPNSWIPLYTAVAFTTIPYKQCMESRQRQDKIIKKAFFWSAAGLFAGTVLTTCRYLSFSEGS